MKLQLVFDEKPRRGRIERLGSNPGGFGACERIAKTLYQQGVDVSSLIYDEALFFIFEGDYFAATERLRMLHTLNPTDIEALILLSKTLAARKNWQEANHYLDIAIQTGAVPPKELKEFIEQGLYRDFHSADVERKRALQRDRREIKKLKFENKKLRVAHSSASRKKKHLAKKLYNAYHICVIITAISLAFLLNIKIQSPVKEAPTQAQETTKKVPSKTVPDTSQNLTNQNQDETDSSKQTDPVQNKPVQKQPVQTEPVQTEPIQKKPTAPQYPIMHKIRRGDTLGKISERYYGTHRLWKHIRDYNNIQPDKLRVGQSIQIPAPN